MHQLLAMSWWLSSWGQQKVLCDEMAKAVMKDFSLIWGKPWGQLKAIIDVTVDACSLAFAHANFYWYYEMMSMLSTWLAVARDRVNTWCWWWRSNEIAMSHLDTGWWRDDKVAMSHLDTWWWRCSDKIAVVADLLKMTTLSAMSKASSWSCVTRILVTPTLWMMSLTESRKDLRTWATANGTGQTITWHGSNQMYYVFFCTSWPHWVPHRSPCGVHKSDKKSRWKTKTKNKKQWSKTKWNWTTPNKTKQERWNEVK